MAVQLYGTLTSPYVRRVRIVLAELEVAYEFVDTTKDPGQAALRALNPLWKVPALRLNGEGVLDSAVITQRLLVEFGTGNLAPFNVTDWACRELVTVIDGALDASINAFYLGKDGVGSDQAPYLQKQRDRAAASLQWLEERIDGPWLTREKRLGLPEIALLTALGWMTFRSVYPSERHASLVRFMTEHADRASVRDTRPRE